MQENNNFILLNNLAIHSLSREEYADFLTIMGKIRDRSIGVLETLKENSNNTDSKLRYPHDLELNIAYKLFQNNQKGERTKLSEYSEIPLLVKIPLDQDPKKIIQDICNYISDITK